MKNKRLIAGIMALLIAAVCLLPAAGMAATKVKLDQEIRYYKGTATISWTVEGDEAPSYKVYMQMVDHGTAKQTMFYLGETKSHSLQTVELIPGYTYAVYVTDENYSFLVTRDYSIPEAGTFEDGKLKNTSVDITTDIRKKDSGGNFAKVNKLSAQEIMNALDKGKESYGMKYTMKMPTLAKQRTYMMTLAFESPDGYVCVDKAQEYTFERVADGYERVWFSLAGDNFFKFLYKTTGSIPTGQYKVILFWDGLWVNTTTFDVR